MSLIPLGSFLKSSNLEYKIEDIVSNYIFKPRKDCKKISLDFPIDWEATDQKQDRNWRMQLQGWAIFFPIITAFDNYDDKKLLTKFFFDIVSDWYNKYGDDPDDIVTTRMPESYAWYDMSVGFRALMIAFFSNRIKVFNLTITESEERLINKLIDKHIAHLSNEKVFSLNNHGIFQIQGLMALIQVKGIVHETFKYQYALSKMEELVRSQFDNQGIHLENSPHYHFYALTIFQNILLNDWYDSKPVVKEIVKKAIAVKKWLVDPLCRTACIGDSVLTRQRHIDFRHKDFSNQLEIKTSNGVLSKFHNSGYQIYRSKWSENPEKSSYIFFMGMYHSKVHKHRDCLSFEWYENGKKKICDSGKYGYVSNEYRNYFLSSKAHNSVEIEGFNILKVEPYGSCLEKAYEKNNLIIMTGKLDYPNISHQRQLLIKPGSWIIVCDDLKYQNEKRTTQWFHPDKSFKLKNLKDNRVVLEDNLDNLLVINCLNNSLDTQIYFGDDKYMQGFISEKDFVYEKSLAIGFSGSIKELSVKTILALSEEAELDALSHIPYMVDKYHIGSVIHEVPKRVLGSLINVNRVEHMRFDLLIGKYTYTYFYGQLILNFYADIKSMAKKLTILLPGAVNRSKTLYHFQRHSWSEDIEGSVISFLDPTVQPENDITIGWFQGNNRYYAIPVLVKFIKEILKVNNLDEENLTIFGSSAGGFSSLKIADSFPSSRIIVVNPQTRIYSYSHKAYKKLVDWVFPRLTLEEATKQHKERLEVDLKVKDRQGVIYYYQNIEDEHHLYHHLEPCLSRLDENLYSITKGIDKPIISKKKLQIIKYSDKESGHSPLGKEDTLKILNS